MNNDPNTFAIIGGGVSGLSAAWYLKRLCPESQVSIFESSDMTGGVLQTVREGDFLIEQAADMFVARPDSALELCRELGIDDELITTKPVEERAFIGLGDQLYPVPQGLSMMVPTRPQPILETKLLTDAGKQRFLSEDQIAPAQSDEDESLKSFAVRRFGIEAYEKIIQPMVSGIYTADPEKLSMRATMKRFVDMERMHGSLIAGTASSSEDQAARGARYDLFRAPRGGIGQLISSLSEALSQLPDTILELNSPVSSIGRSGQQWTVDVDGNSQSFDGLIMATGAETASQMLTSVDSQLSRLLAGIETASSAIVAVGINRNQLEQPFDGFGIIYPHIDNGQVIAISFSSNKFAGRCNDDQLLIRAFIGGAMQSELVDLDDEALIEIALAQLDKSVGLEGQPIFNRVFRWRNCMPQYHLGHVERVEQIETLVGRHTNFALAGNSYRGVGIPACVESGKNAASKVLQFSPNSVPPNFDLPSE